MHRNHLQIHPGKDWKIDRKSFWNFLEELSFLDSEIGAYFCNDLGVVCVGASYGKTIQSGLAACSVTPCIVMIENGTYVESNLQLILLLQLRFTFLISEVVSFSSD